MTESSVLSRIEETARFRAWVALLDACAANLDAFAEAEANGWEPTEGWNVPTLGDVAHLGPLPPSLATRVESLLERTADCEQRAAARMRDMRQRDKLTSKMRFQGTTPGTTTGLLDNAG